VKTLLDEFADIMSEDLPRGLPPTRGIQHAIDLNLGVALPNQATYCMPPKHIDLTIRGLLRESKSPCSFPALLAPKKDGS